MPFASIGKPRYEIDKSEGKYKTQADRLLNILFYSDELPSDLYNQMNMKYDNYRKVISQLKQRELIRKIDRDGLIGYVLTSGGRELVKQLDYVRYKDCIKEKKGTDYSVIRRSRRRQFAYLYALFDRAGIPYETFNKPFITDYVISGDKIYFYTALDFKRLLGIKSTTIKGSRVLGFFIGKGRIIPVYRTNMMLKSFGSYEGLIPEYLKRDFTMTTNEAVLICENEKAVIDITNQIIYDDGTNKTEGIHTAYYDNFYVVPSNDSFIVHFRDLFNDNSGIEQAIISKYEIQTTETSEHGIVNVLPWNGLYKNDPILIFAGNVDVVKAKDFILEAKHQKRLHYIICTERDKNYLEAIAKSPHIQIMVIKRKEKKQ